MRSQISRICEVLESSSTEQGSAVNSLVFSAPSDSSRSNGNSASDRQLSVPSAEPVVHVFSGNSTVTRNSDVAGAS